MKVKITLLGLVFCSVMHGQDKVGADKAVKEGVALHDKGDYLAAIKIYDNALAMDKNNLLALNEKAMTLNVSQRFDEAIKICQKVIKEHRASDIGNIYVIYGNSLSQQKKAKEALAIYDEGLKRFPDFYQLYFNKGITAINMGATDMAIGCFQKSSEINPYHAGSLNALGVIEMNTNRIASILAITRFLIIEQQTARSKGNLNNLQKLMNQGVSQTGENTVSINLDAATIDKVNEKGGSQANDFSVVDMILTMSAALDFDEKFKDTSDTEKFIRKFEVICSSMEENKSGNSGFYWEHLVPYFIELKNKDLLEPLAYLIFVDSNSQEVFDWHKNNQHKLDRFYDWSNEYDW